MTPAEMIGTDRRLIDKVTSLRVENEKLSPAMAGQRVESQALKDESCAAELRFGGFRFLGLRRIAHYH